MYMRLVYIICLSGLLLSACEKKWGENPVSVIDPIKVEYPIAFEQLEGRDPFVFVDTVSKKYYLTFNNMPHFRMYSSPDLKNWKDEGYAFTAASDFWGKQDFWAPDLYAFKNKYYLFATFSAPGTKRGTSVLMADKPVGPYNALENQAVTPPDWTCLDGSLFIDGTGNPWMVFCREWLEVTDGLVYAMPLTGDLKKGSGSPVLLFNASSADWVAPIQSGAVTGYVTDAPYVFKNNSGKLQMLWSSYDKKGNYAIGLAESESGTVTGPWKQLPGPLNNDDGGHAMIFKGLDGQQYIAYHAPNTGVSRPRIYPVQEENDRVNIIK